MGIHSTVDPLALVAICSRLSADGVAREKMTRGTLYVLRLVIYLLQKRHGHEELLAKLKPLAGLLSEGRRLYRQMKYTEAIMAIRKALLQRDAFLRRMAVLRHACLVYHHATDQVIFLNAFGFFASIDRDYWKKVSTGGWMLSLFFAIASDTYKIVTGNKKAQARLLSPQQDMVTAEEKKRAQEEARTWEAARTRLLLSVAKNVADMPVAIEGTFKFQRLDAGQLALCGIFSSIISIYLAWPKDSNAK